VGARLLWRDAQGLEGTIDLGAAEVKIGRAVDCAIRTDDAMVSRYHARVYWGGQGFVLEDNGSANGVFYQDVRVQTHVFKHGDAVRCGSLWLRFIDLAQFGQAAADPPTSAQPPAAPVGAPPQVPPHVPPHVPMMQHPGMGAVGQHGNTGHAMNAVSPQQLAAMGAPVPAAPAPASAGPDPQAEEEIRRLRRRIEQVQAELRILRGGKVGADKARRMEDLENDLAAMEEEKGNLKAKIADLEAQLVRESGNVKVQRAVEIRGKAAEIVTSLNDLLSSLRIEVMAAEGEFDQYSHSIPRASFELIRQSLRESAGHIDGARDLLRQLRDLAG
jgi:hypothetical protein